VTTVKSGFAGVSREALMLVHHHPGRLRVRASIFRHIGEGAAVSARVLEALGAMVGVTRCEHNARTGSLLIEYEPDLAEPDAIAACIADTAGIARADTGAMVHRDPGRFVIDAAREINDVVHELTGFRADLRTMIPAGLAATAAFAFAQQKGKRLPRWDNLLYWSYNVFVSLHGAGAAPEATRDPVPTSPLRVSVTPSTKPDP
jgi:Heavy metal associated domain 2